jgi:hypothetical protein
MKENLLKLRMVVAEADWDIPQFEFNVGTTSQVEVAKSKNWTVYGIYDGKEWHEYAGSETTAIRNQTRQDSSAERYSLDGHRISSQDKHKGLYIQNGKKIVMK